jgi:ATP-binding cassette subfamily B protein
VLARGRESVRSIAEVLEDPDLEHNHDKRDVQNVVGRLALEGVGFVYPGDPQPALDGIDLDVAPGETIAFVGPSGSGKSTMLNLVLGFVRPTSGRILLDGRDTAELDLRQARQFFSVVPQESVLFEGSIRENVQYGLRNVSDDELERVLRDANALDFVRELPDGWDSVVGQRGARLSGGQRQRLAIARALLKDAPVLILDEPTSALDAETEDLVLEALQRLRQGRTTLVIAHRMATVQSADRVVVIVDGRVAEIGTHAELLSAGGVYRQFCETQFGSVTR